MEGGEDKIRTWSELNDIEKLNMENVIQRQKLFCIDVYTIIDK